MKKILSVIGSIARRLVNFAVRALLEVFYYAALWPAGLLIRARADFLDTGGRHPNWSRRPDIKDTQNYLHSQ